MTYVGWMLLVAKLWWWWYKLVRRVYIFTSPGSNTFSLYIVIYNISCPIGEAYNDWQERNYTSPGGTDILVDILLFDIQNCNRDSHQDDPNKRSYGRKIYHPRQCYTALRICDDSVRRVLRVQPLCIDADSKGNGEGGPRVAHEADRTPGTREYRRESDTLTSDD